MQNRRTRPDTVILLPDIQILKIHLAYRNFCIGTGDFTQFFGSVYGLHLIAMFQKIFGISAGTAAKIKNCRSRFQSA